MVGPGRHHVARSGCGGVVSIPRTCPPLIFAPFQRTGVKFAAPLIRHDSPGRGMVLRASSEAPEPSQASQPGGQSGSSAAQAAGGKKGGSWSFFQPLSDPECNRRFWAIVAGQLLCSVATLVHDTYLPLYLSQDLGLSNTKIGALQAISQFLAQMAKGVSGVAGDLLRSQIKVVIFGTFLTFLCKPLFVLSAAARSVVGTGAALWMVGIGKMLDRTSKGIREAPTKALVQQLARESGDTSEAAFGMRQSLATMGALLGSFVAATAFALSGRSYVLTFAVAAVPPLLALLWLLASFQDRMELPMPEEEQRSDPSTSEAQPGAAEQPSAIDCFTALVQAFQPAYWQALAVMAVLYLARFDFSFVMLRAKQMMAPEVLPVLVSMSMIAQTICAPYFGRLARGTGVRGRNRILVAGFGMLLAANLVMSLPYFASATGMLLGCLLIGLHMGMTHGLLISMCSTYMPHTGIPGLPSLAGTAMSFTDIVLGFVLAWANVAAGRLSDATRAAGLGNVGCFAGGAVASAAAALLLLAFDRFGDLGKQELVQAKPAGSKRS